MQTWLAKQPQYQCLVNPKHCLYNHTDPKFTMSMRYFAILTYLQEHPKERVPELRSLIQTMCHHVVENAKEKNNLFLLSGARPTQVPLSVIKRQFPRIKEIDLAIALFGETQVPPLHAIFKCMGETPSIAWMEKKFRERKQQLKSKTKKIIVEKAAEEKCDEVVVKQLGRILPKIKSEIWLNFMYQICHALRNITCTPYTMRLLVYKYCPKKYHDRVDAHFNDKCKKIDGMRMLETLSKQ